MSSPFSFPRCRSASGGRFILPWMLALLCLGCWLPPVLAQSAPVTEPLEATSENASPVVIDNVPPRPSGLHIYVNDLSDGESGGLLTPQDRARLQERLQALDEAGIAQISVLVLPDTDRDLSEFAPQIMNRWGIQHAGKKDGLLVLVNARRLKSGLSGNRVFIGTGYNLESILPDAVIGRILDAEAVPAFAKGDFSGGITRATLTIADILAGDKPLKSRYSRPAPEDPPWIALIFFLILFIMLANLFNRRGGGGGWGGGFFGGGYYGGFGGDFSGGGGGGFSGGFGGGGDSSGGGGAGR